MNAIRLNTKLIKSLSDVLFMTASEMMDAAQIPCTTWYAIRKKPEDITIQYLLAIANGLHIPVRRFFSTEKATIIGKRDDYITEPYQECIYDADALQEMVDNHADITWKKASDATGITYDNLRKSLLAVRKTPVTRFLTACEAFNINPFTILIDPNPTPKKKRKTTVPAGSPAGSDETLRAEVKALTGRLADMNATIADLTQKYDDLMQRHTALLDRHNQLERKFNDFMGYGSMKVAEDIGGDI